MAAPELNRPPRSSKRPPSLRSGTQNSDAVGPASVPQRAFREANRPARFARISGTWSPERPEPVTYAATTIKLPVAWYIVSAPRSPEDRRLWRTEATADTETAAPDGVPISGPSVARQTRRDKPSL